MIIRNAKPGTLFCATRARRVLTALRGQVLETLESDYRDLSREFGSEPRSSISVVLYTNQAFFDVTHARAWVGA